MDGTTKGPGSVEEYINSFPPEIQTLLNQMRAAVREAVPQAQEKISYGMPTYFWKKNLVHFAAFKHHIGFYPTPSGTTEFAEDLLAFKTSKGAVQFPLDKPLPLDLVRRMTLFRFQEVSRDQKSPGINTVVK